MVQIKKEYFIKGVDNQKRADIVFDFKRKDSNKFISLLQEDKLKIIEFLKECQNHIQVTINKINNG